VYLLLVALHTILASEGLEAHVALGTDSGVQGTLSPYFVLGPNVTVLLLLILSISPITVLFGTASVSGGMFPEREREKLSNIGH